MKSALPMQILPPAAAVLNATCSSYALTLADWIGGNQHYRGLRIGQLTVASDPRHRSKCTGDPFDDTSLILLQHCTSVPLVARLPSPADAVSGYVHVLLAVDGAVPHSSPFLRHVEEYVPTSQTSIR